MSLLVTPAEIGKSAELLVLLYPLRMVLRKVGILADNERKRVLKNHVYNKHQASIYDCTQGQCLTINTEIIDS